MSNCMMAMNVNTVNCEGWPFCLICVVISWARCFFFAKNFRSWARFWCVMCSVYRYLICLNLIFWQAPLSFSGNFGLLGVLSGRGYSTNHEADLVVIGSGPGGYVAAIKAAQLGLKVSVSFGVVILILSCVRVCSSSQLYNWWCPIDSVQL